MEAPPVSVMPVTGGSINMMEYLLQGNGTATATATCIHPSEAQGSLDLGLCLVFCGVMFLNCVTRITPKKV